MPQNNIVTFDDVHSDAYDKYIYDAYTSKAPSKLDVGGVIGEVPSDIPVDENTAMHPIGSKAQEAYGLVKGGVQSELALPNFFEGLARGIFKAVKNPEDQGRIKSFLEGMDEAKWPDIKQWKTILKEIGVPDVAATKSAELMEGIGEAVAPGAGISIAGKLGSKAIKKVGKTKASVSVGTATIAGEEKAK